MHREILFFLMFYYSQSTFGGVGSNSLINQIFFIATGEPVYMHVEKVRL